MFRRALVLLLAAGVTLAGPTLKSLLDPANKDYPLRAYDWSEWEQLDRQARFEAKGARLSDWEDPPPEELTEEEKEKREEKRRKIEEAKKNGTYQYPRDRVPGFRFEQRLKKKQAAFEQLIQPAAPAKLAGLIKQMKLFDKALDRFQKTIDAEEEEYLKYKGQLDKITANKAENYKKRFGKYPDSVLVPAALQGTVFRHSRRLQRLLSIRQSETQFQAWILDRVAALIGELTPAERKEPVAALVRGVAHKDWRYRIRCARLLGRLEDPLSVAAFGRAIKSEADPMVLAELVRIRSARGGEGVLDVLAARLDDERWPVRAAVVRALAKLRTKRSVDLLVRRMAKEDGRLLDDIAGALRALTGKDFEPEPEPWRVWWEKVRLDWKPPPEVAPGGTQPGERDARTVYFYGIRTNSRRVVFCIDTSGSMNWPLDGKDGKKPPRIVRAKKELTQALIALPEDARFNIVVYSTQVRLWKKRMQQASPGAKQAARKFVEDLEPSGGTNIFDALLASLDVAATAGKRKPRKGAPPAADTLFFLTDGQPTVGRITDPHQIIEEITSRNAMLGVTIHTVGVSKDQNAGFLLNLAKRNHGRYAAHK